MSFSGIFSKFYTTIVLRVICFFVFIRSTAKKGADFPQCISLFGEHDSLAAFLYKSRKPVRVPSKMSLIYISLMKSEQKEPLEKFL